MTASELNQYFEKIFDSGKIPHAVIVDGARTEEEKAPVFELIKKLMGSMNHQDVIRLTHEKQHLISIDEVRAQVVDNIIIKPYARPYKIYIIDDAELMNGPAQNTLLKTLEEPPSYAIIFLLTGNASGLLDTIISRCVYLQLAETDAAPALDPETEKNFREIAAKIPWMSELTAHQTAKEITKNAKDKTATLLQFFDIIKDTYVQALIYKEGAGTARSEQVKKLAEQPESTLLKQLAAIEKAGWRCRISVNAEINLRDAFMEMRG